MQTRYCAAATALLLTAGAGMAATGAAAEAAGAHHAGAKAAKSLTVTIKTTKKAPKLSRDTLRPGRTTFRVVRGNRGGLIQVLRLKKGYSFAEAASDFGKAFPENGAPDVKAVRRIDRKVVFYGGMPTPAKDARANKWAVDIDKAGTYYVVNLDRNNLSTFRAKGKHQNRSWPSADGKLNIADGNIWKPGNDNARKGWMSTTNRAEEPHFAVLNHVKDGTTIEEVIAYFSDPSAPPVPPFAAADGASADTGVISPGHTFRWSYRLPKGSYLAQCFWPSKVDGTPHAFMGMLALMDLG